MMEGYNSINVNRKKSPKKEGPVDSTPYKKKPPVGYTLVAQESQSNINQIIQNTFYDEGLYRFFDTGQNYLPSEKVGAVIKKISRNLTAGMIHIPRIRKTNATSLIFDLFSQHQIIHDFQAAQPYYQDFKEETGKLGLHPDFDKWPKKYDFTAPASSGPKEEFAELNGFLRETVVDLTYPAGDHAEEILLNQALQRDVIDFREKLSAKKPSNPEFLTLIFKYYEILLVIAKKQNQPLVKNIAYDINDCNQLSALSRINEFYRDKIGNEIIALEENKIIKSALNIILDETLKGINKFFSKFNLSFLAQTSGKKINYSLKMDPRDADSLYRGVVSSDCTDICKDYAFHETVPQHLLDPGFNCFRLFEGEKWVGNIYWLVAKVNQEPSIIIDAIQTSENHHFGADTTEIAEKIIETIKTYRSDVGFKKLYLSRFISNRGLLNFYFSKKYPALQQTVEKIGGFRHLKDLNLWNPSAFRNEYIETIMPGNPNLDAQKLPLREIP